RSRALSAPRRSVRTSSRVPSTSHSVRERPYSTTWLSAVAYPVELFDGRCAALDDSHFGHAGEPRVIVELFQGEAADVAHGGANLRQGNIQLLSERSAVRDVGIDPFFEYHSRAFALLVALPVARAVGALSPVRLVQASFIGDFAGRAFLGHRE